MTSVPNLLPQSNGSKLLLGLTILVALVACSTSSVATRTKSPEILTPDKEAPDVEKPMPGFRVDTIRWTLVSDPPITSDMAPVERLPSEKQDVYEIALLIPFRTTGFYDNADLDANKQKFAHFYAGMKQAIKNRRGGPAQINITTYDTNRSDADFDKVLSRMTLHRPDLIVGPYETDLISRAATFAKENRIPIISPWRASTRITRDNVYFLQLRPNITEYYAKIIAHINDNFNRREVRILGRKNGEDAGKIRAVQEINQERSPLPVTEAFTTMLIDKDSLMVADSLVFDRAFEQQVKAFFLPHFSSRDEDFVYSCLRKLYAEKAEREVFIYTMPLVLNSDRIDINILKNLNIRICEYRFADLRNPEIQRFRQSYFDDFGWLPTEDSYFGFDVMNFIFYGLDKYGKYFHYYLENELVDLAQMSVYIERFTREKDDDHIDYMMNSHLYIISFEGERFTIRDIR